MAWLILTFIICQRLGELIWASRNTKRLLALGAVESSPKHYRWIVLLHTTWIATIALSLALKPSAGVDPWFLGFFVLLTCFRAWILWTLGSFFTTKIISLPGAPLKKSGPYRFLKHPNYLLVSFEIVIVPLIFGFWQIALVWGLTNIAVLYHRIRAEDVALLSRRKQ